MFFKSKIFFQNLTLIYANFLIIFKCQIIFSDEVPFVFQQQGIKLFESGNGNLQGTQIINYSNKLFQQTPIIIVGIDFFNNFWNAPHGVDFIISSESVAINNCVVKATRNNGSDLVGISVSLLALDTSQFPYFNKIDDKILGIQFNNYKYQKSYQFSPNLQNQGQKSVSVVLTGWAQYAFTSAKSVLAITIQVTDLTDTGYTITITSAQQSQGINNVYFSILEYIQNPPQSIFGIISNYDTLYQQPTTQKCFYDTSCSNSQRYFPVCFNVLIQNQSPSTSDYSNFFVSINQFYFTTQMDGQDQRINIVNKPLSSNQIQYQYQIWDGAQCQGTTSTALYFYKKVCPIGQFVNTITSICSNVCQNQYNSQICLDCSQGQYFLQDQNICQTIQPTGYCCSIPSSQANYYVCQIFNIANCQYCTQNSDNTFQCTQCMSSYFLYLNSCSQAQPPNTFCDNSLICSKCLDMSCLTCSDPSQPLSQCLSCDASQNQALYEGKCYTKNSAPNNTFCDWSILVCTQCSDPSCLTCSDPSISPQICESCNQNQAIYEGKCYAQNSPPQNTFCDWKNQICTKCQDSSCLSCSDPAQTPQKCLLCNSSQKQILYNGKCFSQSSPPSNTFCDWSILQCLQCIDISCLACSNPQQSPQICLSCIDNLNNILYLGKCYCGIGFYLDENNRCSQKCVQGCLLCLNSHSCDKYSDNRIYSDNECNYSCQQCFIPKQNYGCTKCSSPTRQLETITGSCFCKDGYSDIGNPECQNDNALKPFHQIETTDPSSFPQQYLQCTDNKNQILFEGKYYTQNSPPKNTFCDWEQMKCTKCVDSNYLFCIDPNNYPQVCLSCDQSIQKLALYQGKCFTQNSPSNNNFCDWNNQICSQCRDIDCLSCSYPNQPPQVCLSCNVALKKIHYQDKCFSSSEPPPNTFCDWNLLKCSLCNDKNCFICKDPSLFPQQCLQWIDS
ncbi:hypothetical protein ABPG72_021612 [Tetrahymena utriculariae]